MFTGLCRLEQAVCYSDLSKLTHLDLSGNRLTELPPSLDKMINLEHLDVSDNQLANLPHYIMQFDKLKSIRLSGNNFASEVDDKVFQHSDLADMQSWLFK